MKSRRLKICFLTPSLYGGGAERVLVILLRHLDRRRFDPCVVMFEPKNDYPDEIPDDVRIILIRSKGLITAPMVVARLAMLLKRERPDIVLTSLYRVHYLSLVTALARRLSGTSARFVLTEHGNLSWCMATAKLKGLRSRIIRSRYLYPETDTIVCVSKGLQDDLTQQWNVLSSRTMVIHNPVELDRIHTMMIEAIDHPWFLQQKRVFVACGRMDPQKNYKLLLKAFCIAQGRETDIKLMVLGEGPLRKELVDMAESLGLSDAIAFPGFVKNPFKFIARAHALVLSSDMEGFPMVLIEAMACSTPVISTRCPSGPDEIVRDGENGLLVPVGDAVALADAIIKLSRDVEMRARIAIAGWKSVEKLSASLVAREYEKLFEGII